MCPNKVIVELIEYILMRPFETDAIVSVSIKVNPFDLTAVRVEKSANHMILQTNYQSVSCHFMVHGNQNAPVQSSNLAEGRKRTCKQR